MTPDHPEAVEYAAAASELERAAAPPAAISFTKEDLIFIATGDSSIRVRRSAAEVLYLLGKCDGAREITQARTGAAVST